MRLSFLKCLQSVLCATVDWIELYVAFFFPTCLGFLSYAECFFLVKPEIIYGFCPEIFVDELTGFVPDPGASENEVHQFFGFAD